jgi:hypothetical protein
MSLDTPGPGSTRDQRTEALLRALTDLQADEEGRIRWAILKQEVWRLLVELRGSEGEASDPASRLRALIPALVEDLTTDGVSVATASLAETRLVEALEAVQDWPLV